MNIEYKDYIIKQSQNSAGFDLIRKVVRTKKGSEETYEGESNLGYDMKLESCFNKIIMEEMKNDDRIVELKEFLEEYNKQKEDLLQTVKLD